MNVLNATMPLLMNMLIVDDEPDICYFLSGNFKRRGFNAFFAHTLAEAEKQLELNSPDILLLDNYLPDGRGIDFLSKVKTDYPHLKIVMITAHDSPQDRLKAYGNGIDFFLSKPFTLTEVNQVVDLLVGES